MLVFSFITALASTKLAVLEPCPQFVFCLRGLLKAALRWQTAVLDLGPRLSSPPDGNPPLCVSVWLLSFLTGVSVQALPRPSPNRPHLYALTPKALNGALTELSPDGSVIKVPTMPPPQLRHQRGVHVLLWVHGNSFSLFLPRAAQLVLPPVLASPFFVMFRILL